MDVTLTKPDTTAEMEFALAEIAAGEGSVKKFRQDVYDTIDRNIAYAEAHQFPGYIMEKCPLCKTGNLVKHFSRKTKKAFFVCDNQACVSPGHYSPKTKQYFYVCDDKTCVSPLTKKTVFYAVDKDGNPVIEHCPQDNAVLEKKKGRYGFFWSCPQCRTIYKDSKGRPKL